ncbi:MAG: efflux RND transporter periplasmic adaptor subunit [Endomicrobium sp.]|jgi:RND family efflux transporter MFP subunit|nr:efflux RND transporter periplasmic adaptor subunit [Endomicrobium sp.]
MIKKFKLVNVGAVCLFFCFQLYVLGCSSKKSSPERAARVNVLRIDASSVSNSLSFSGTFEAQKVTDESFLIPGTVLKIDAAEGDYVKKGQILAQLDAQVYEKALEAVNAKAAQAQDAYNRYRPIFERGNLPEVKMVEIETMKKETESALAIAQKELQNCYLTAARDGYISKKYAEAGDSVFPGQKIFKLMSIDKLYAVIYVPEKDMAEIKKGADAVVSVSGADERKIKGKVVSVGVFADILSRAYGVKVLIDNSGQNLLPGMLCMVNVLRSDGKSGQIIIPAAAVKLDVDGGRYVYCVNEETKRVFKRPVVLGGFAGEGISVLSGLSVGDLIVSEGVQKLEEGVLTEYK